MSSKFFYYVFGRINIYALKLMLENYFSIDFLQLSNEKLKLITKKNQLTILKYFNKLTDQIFNHIYLQKNGL